MKIVKQYDVCIFQGTSEATCLISLLSLLVHVHTKWNYKPNRKINLGESTFVSGKEKLHETICLYYWVNITVLIIMTMQITEEVHSVHDIMLLWMTNSWSCQQVFNHTFDPLIEWCTAVCSQQTSNRFNYTGTCSCTSCSFTLSSIWM